MHGLSPHLSDHRFSILVLIPPAASILPVATPATPATPAPPAAASPSHTLVLLQQQQPLLLP